MLIRTVVVALTLLVSGCRTLATEGPTNCAAEPRLPLDASPTPSSAGTASETQAAPPLNVEAAHAPGGEAQASRVDLATVEIVLERSECAFWCPNYTLTIGGDGRVSYEGRSFVKEVGERHGRISEVAVRALLQRFEEVRFFERDPEYKQSVRDPATTVLVLRVGDRTSRVLNYGARLDHVRPGLRNKDQIQEALWQLADAIDAAVHATAWIGTEEEQAPVRSPYRTGRPGRTKLD